MRRLMGRFSFLLAGIALSAAVGSGFMWYAAGQHGDPPYVPSHHKYCGEPVALRAEDYNLWGSTRSDSGVELALIDICDPVQVQRADGLKEVWFWMEVEVTGQVFPYAGWGYYWVDVETPFPADPREPRNPWWTPRTGLQVYPNELGYTGGRGYHCIHDQARARGLDLFFYLEDGFQLPVNTTHSGWVCVYFDGGRTLPNAFTVTVQPDRARIVQWVDKLITLGGYDVDEISIAPLVQENELCDYARFTHPETIQLDGPCNVIK